MRTKRRETEARAAAAAAAAAKEGEEAKEPGKEEEARSTNGPTSLARGRSS
jgi:hypothetical protein